SLENYRAASDEILLLPLASLKGVTEVESSSRIASTIKEQLNRLNQDRLIGERILVVENVDDDTIPMCRLRNKNSPIASGEAEFKLGGSSFANFSDESLAIIKRELSEPSIEKAYSNFEVRYLNTRCIGAGTQILYNGFREIPGLLQMMQFSDLSMVVSGTIPSGGKMSPTSQELLETGRAVSIPLTSVILGHEKAESAFAQENAARLIASGHLQVGYCIASAKPENVDPSDVQYLLKKSQTKDLFCKATPAHNGYLELVKARKSDYQLGTELESILSELDEYSPEYGVYLSNLISDKMSTKAVADALPRMYGHMNFITAIPHWLPPNEKAKYGVSIEYIPSFEKNSGRYFLTSGDSGTTISVFGLFPMFMLSTVQDVPVSGGISVVPSTSGQDVQSGNGSNCR
ncbi:MAG: hypothetical protein RJB13_2026, partial [Pseudomonadota bacterium]